MPSMREGGCPFILHASRLEFPSSRPVGEAHGLLGSHEVGRIRCTADYSQSYRDRPSTAVQPHRPAPLETWQL